MPKLQPPSLSIASCVPWSRLNKFSRVIYPFAIYFFTSVPLSLHWAWIALQTPGVFFNEPQNILSRFSLFMPFFTGCPHGSGCIAITASMCAPTIKIAGQLRLLPCPSFGFVNNVHERPPPHPILWTLTPRIPSHRPRPSPKPSHLKECVSGSKYPISIK